MRHGAGWRLAVISTGTRVLLIQQAGFEMERYDIYDLGVGTRILGTHHVGVERKR